MSMSTVCSVTAVPEPRPNRPVRRARTAESNIVQTVVGRATACVLPEHRAHRIDERLDRPLEAELADIDLDAKDEVDSEPFVSPQRRGADQLWDEGSPDR